MKDWYSAAGMSAESEKVLVKEDGKFNICLVWSSAYHGKFKQLNEKIKDIVD